MDIEEQIQDITAIQNYIIKKINNTRYGYTTLQREDRNEILLELALNWIDHQVEKEKLINM